MKNLVRRFFFCFFLFNAWHELSFSFCKVTKKELTLIVILFFILIVPSGLLFLKKKFPCPESKILEAPGIVESCIFTRSYGPTTLSEYKTPEQVMMQCLAHYPISSWVIYRQHTEVHPHQVRKQWMRKKCTDHGWSEPEAVENGDKVRDIFHLAGILLPSYNGCFDLCSCSISFSAIKDAAMNNVLNEVIK